MKRIITLLFIAITYTTQAQIPCVVNASSLTFNGTSNYVELMSDNAANIEDSLTIEAWIRPLAWASTSWAGSILSKDGWSVTEQGYVLRCGGGGQLSFNFAGIDSLGNITSWKEVLSPPTALASYLNTWVHVAATYDGNDSKIYINGVLSASLHFKGSIVASPDYHLHMGCFADVNQGVNRLFEGKIDEVRLWHRALSQSEIAATMSVHIDPALQTGLTGYWRFNENTGTTVNDLSSNAITGTLVGAAWGTVVPFNNVPFAPVITNPTFSTLHSNAATNIQWNLNGVPLINDTLQNLVYTQNGSYTVTVTNAVGCSATSLPFIVVNAGIKDYTADNTVIVSPNPATNLITVTIMNAKDFNQLLLSDVTGRVLVDKAIDKSNADKIQIDLSAFTKGVYFVKLMGNTKLVTKQFVIE